MPRPAHEGERSTAAPPQVKSARNVRFNPDANGALAMWRDREIDPVVRVTDRYLVVVDIGGRSLKADWTVIAVFDRRPMSSGGKPEIVAQMARPHRFRPPARNAAGIAAYYCNALLVVESNTLETADRDRSVDGDQSAFLLNQIRGAYPNLYARRYRRRLCGRGTARYGFHTNVATKPMVISTLVRAIREGLYVERGEALPL